MIPAALHERPGDSARIDTPASSGRRSFAICIAAACVLNASALSVVLATVTRWQIESGARQQTHWITAVTARASERERASELAGEAAPIARPLPPRPEPDAQTVATASLELSVEPKPLTIDVSEGNETRFYKFGEVDRAAEPDSDWNLDTAALDSAGVKTLVFDIFVGRTGEVVGCAILEPAALAPEVRRSLESRLRGTVLRPAERGGTAVASVRRIEVSVLPPMLPLAQ